MCKGEAHGRAEIAGGVGVPLVEVVAVTTACREGVAAGVAAVTTAGRAGVAAATSTGRAETVVRAGMNPGYLNRVVWQVWVPLVASQGVALLIACRLLFW